jgi:phenol hydroxylase P4 protein
LTIMTVNAIGHYDFPSADRAELFGDDQLVYVHWRGNLTLCSAATFRAPKAMTWADFRAAMVDDWAASDPDYDAGAVGDWTLDGADFAPDPAASLADQGIGHKSLLTFGTA